MKKSPQSTPAHSLNRKPAPQDPSAHRTYQPLSDPDIYLFKEGNHFRLYQHLGAHETSESGIQGTHFAVWAPNARAVSVIGEFNGWDPQLHPLNPRWDASGIWEGFIPGVLQGSLYKFHILGNDNNYKIDKSDPFAFYSEKSPKTASVVWNLGYEWRDDTWMKERRCHNSLDAPLSIYEVHLGSWKRVTEEGDRFLTYRELAPPLIEYVKRLGFTHVEFMPVMEHPFYGSWGYQSLGYFCPTSRFGEPQDLMYLIDQLHQNGIGVILDWVPSHFPTDGHGLSYFDGTHLYEHADPQKGYHPDWGSYIFNHGRNEVREFLISSALFWLDKYHADGLRVDAVASMLYLDYSRKEGEWSPNQHGGKENIEAISFIKRLNEVVYQNFPDVQMIAEESTAWPMVSRPIDTGGLGFGMKWNMGWMHDTLVYFSKDPVHRKHHHNELTFSMLYAFTENFILSFSHDEVVHGKGAMLAKMPRDEWQKFANLRLLFGYMFAHPGKKLLFMGAEFGQWNEWYHERSLDWHLLQYEPHQKLQQWVCDLNSFYRKQEALFTADFSPEGFEWIDCSDWQQGVVSFLRKVPGKDDPLLIVCNLTPAVRENYRIGVPLAGVWEEILTSDHRDYGGSHMLNGIKAADRQPFHGKPFSILPMLPSLCVMFFKRKAGT